MVPPVHSVDVHQHLWPEAVLRVLERRVGAPKARWQGRRWRVDLPGEPTFEVDPRDHDAELARRRPEHRQGARRPLRAPSASRAFPDRDALAAIAAWQEAASSCPTSSAGGPPLPPPSPADEQADIVPGGHRRWRRRSLPPGRPARSPDERADRPRRSSKPSPTPALPSSSTPARPTAPKASPPGGRPPPRYVAQQHAAWHAFHARGPPPASQPRVPSSPCSPASPRFRPSARSPRAARSGSGRSPTRSPSTTPRRTARGR